MMTRALLVLACAFAASPLAAQAKQRRCNVATVNQPNTFDQQENVNGQTNVIMVHRVNLRCIGQPVYLGCDSLFSLAGEIMTLVRSAYYRDDKYALKADTIVYTKRIEQLEARGHVVITDKTNGSTLSGPYVVYLRNVVGVRDSADMQAFNRPTVRYFSVKKLIDTTTAAAATLTANLLHGYGQSRMWGGGNVVIDKDSLHTTSDSLSFINARNATAILLGKPATLTRATTDSLRIIGNELRLSFEDDKLKEIRAQKGARVTSGSSDIIADTVFLGFDKEKLELTRAWGRKKPAVVHSQGYDVEGDSVVIETPGEDLRRLRAFGKSKLQQPLPAVHDSTTERDTIWGKLLTATFIQVDSAGRKTTHLQKLEGSGNTGTLFSQTVNRRGVNTPSTTYVRAAAVTITMKTGDSTGVASVKFVDKADGILLERASLPKSKADSARIPVPVKHP